MPSNMGAHGLAAALALAACCGAPRPAAAAVHCPDGGLCPDKARERRARSHCRFVRPF
jgi:hypothetical protein